MQLRAHVKRVLINLLSTGNKQEELEIEAQSQACHLTGITGATAHVESCSEWVHVLRKHEQVR